MKLITASGFFYLADAASIKSDDSNRTFDFTCYGMDELKDPVKVSLRALNIVDRTNSFFSTMLDGEPEDSPSEPIPLIAPQGISCNLVKDVLEWVESFNGVVTLPTIARPLEEGSTPRETLKKSGFDLNYFQLVENERGVLKSFEELLLMSNLAEYLGFAKVKEVVYAAMAAELWERSRNGTIRDIFLSRSKRAPVLPIHAHPKGYEAAEEEKKGDAEDRIPDLMHPIEIVNPVITSNLPEMRELPAESTTGRSNRSRWPKLTRMKKFFGLSK